MRLQDDGSPQTQMAVLLQTSLGELILDLFIDEVPILAANFLKLCKIKYYNNSIFHSVEKNFIARTGLPYRKDAGSPKDFHEESILRVIKAADPSQFREIVNGCDDFWKPSAFDHETGKLREVFHPRLRHAKRGIISMANERANQIGSSFFITLRDSIDYLDDVRSIIGVVAEGDEVLDKFNQMIVEDHVSNRPLQPIRIFHAIVLDDPFPDPPGMIPVPASPEPIGGEVVDVGGDQTAAEPTVEAELAALEKIATSEAKSRAVALEILGDLPDADLAPPDNILFVCKLNPVTEAEDLELIFSRFGKILSCDIVRDWKTGDSLQYGFIEFEDPKACEAALFKMEGCLIDDRRIHVDFCQSVSKQWSAYRHYGPLQPVAAAQIGGDGYAATTAVKRNNNNRRHAEGPHIHRDKRETEGYAWSPERQPGRHHQRRPSPASRNSYRDHDRHHRTNAPYRDRSGGNREKRYDPDRDTDRQPRRGRQERTEEGERCYSRRSPTRRRSSRSLTPRRSPNRQKRYRR